MVADHGPTHIGPGHGPTHIGLSHVTSASLIGPASPADFDFFSCSRSGSLIRPVQSMQCVCHAMRVLPCVQCMYAFACALVHAYSHVCVHVHMRTNCMCAQLKKIAKAPKKRNWTKLCQRQVSSIICCSPRSAFHPSS